MVKAKEKGKGKKHSKSEKKVKSEVKEKKISKKHKHKPENPAIPEKNDKRKEKSKKKDKELEKFEVPKPDITAPYDPYSTPSPIATNASDSGSQYDPEDLRQLLTSYSKEELVDLICRNAEKGSRLISAVNESSVSQRQIFVRGLGQDTTRERLEATFEPYGEIEKCNVVMDKKGKTKGYGFVLFKTRKGARRALKSPEKKMHNRTVVCHVALGKPSGVGKGQERVEQGKIDLTQMANNHSEVTELELAHGHVVNSAPQHHTGSAMFAGQSMPFFGQPHGFNPMYAAMGNQVVADLRNYAVFGPGVMNQGLMVPPNHMGMVGQYAADGDGSGGGERAWYLR